MKPTPFKYLIAISLVILFPFSSLASGGEVIELFYLDIATFLGLCMFIGIIKWKSRGKAILALILFLSMIITFLSINNVLYRENRIMINTLSVLIPICSVLLGYVLFSKKFRSKK